MTEKHVHFTPDKHHWYDRMIQRGFAERNEAYFSRYANGDPSDIYRELLINSGDGNGQLLDIGCGPGKYTEMFLPGYSHVIGLDRSKNSLKYGNEHHKIPGLEFVLGDSAALPFADDSFDVTSTRLSPHDLSEMMRVLRPQGRAFCMRVGETDGFELRELFGQTDLVEKMRGYIDRGEPHSRHIVERWRQANFADVESSEHEYDMLFETEVDLAKYLSRIPIVPEFDMENETHMEVLRTYIGHNTDSATGAAILHRHRNIITGVKP